MMPALETVIVRFALSTTASANCTVYPKTGSIITPGRSWVPVGKVSATESAMWNPCVVRILRRGSDVLPPFRRHTGSLALPTA